MASIGNAALAATILLISGPQARALPAETLRFSCSFQWRIYPDVQLELSPDGTTATFRDQSMRVPVDPGKRSLRKDEQGRFHFPHYRYIDTEILCFRAQLRP